MLCGRRNGNLQVLKRSMLCFVPEQQVRQPLDSCVVALRRSDHARRWRYFCVQDARAEEDLGEDNHPPSSGRFGGFSRLFWRIRQIYAANEAFCSRTPFAVAVTARSQRPAVRHGHASNDPLTTTLFVLGTIFHSRTIAPFKIICGRIN